MEEKILDKPAETAKYLSFYFSPKDFPDSLLFIEMMAVDAATAQKSLTEAYNWLNNFTGYESLMKIQDGLLALASSLGLKNGQLLWPLRVTLSGEQFSPGVFEIIQALGKEETLKRIEKTLETRFKTAVRHTRTE